MLAKVTEWPKGFGLGHNAAVFEENPINSELPGKQLAIA
jgi:hypothetical protein